MQLLSTLYSVMKVFQSFATKEKLSFVFSHLFIGMLTDLKQSEGPTSTASLPVFARRRLFRPCLVISYEMTIWNTWRSRADGGEETVNVKKSSALQAADSASKCSYMITPSFTCFGVKIAIGI